MPIEENGFSAVFQNKGFDLFEAWIGYRGGEGRGNVRFRVRGDGEELYTHLTQTDISSRLKPALSTSERDCKRVKLTLINSSAA